MRKPRVAFICTHNSCRSQMAEALGRLMCGGVFESYSAGTDIKDAINPDAVRVMKKLYGVDMTSVQRPKLLEELPPVDVAVTMGCGVQCPFIECSIREDWGLEDPTGKDDAAFEKTAKTIEEKILELKTVIQKISPEL
jgi:arsenate reductase